MHDLFNKVKQAASSIPNNKDELVSGCMKVREDSCGEEQASDPLQYSTAVERELSDGRGDLLKRIFDGVPGMVDADKSSVGKLFQNFNSASTTSHSPLLQKKASHAPTLTLAETVRYLR